MGALAAVLGPSGAAFGALWGHREASEAFRKRKSEKAIILAKGPTVCSCEYRVVGTGFGGAPYGATILVRGVPKWWGDRIRALLLKPSVELLMGPQSS